MIPCVALVGLGGSFGFVKVDLEIPGQKPNDANIELA